MTDWILDPQVAHLNHGSFGAIPKALFDRQQGWLRRIEANPDLFIGEELQPALDSSRRKLAGLVGADPEALAFVTNATEGANAVFRSLEPDLAGKHIVVTDHGYNAWHNAAAVTAERAGARLVTASVPFPTDSPVAVKNAVLSAVSADTGLVVLDFVTSPTALRFPVEELVAELEPTVPVLVDAAHAVGMIPLELTTLGASFVVGNGHKWLCAPKGSGFLYTDARFRDRMLPPVVSHALNRDLVPGRSRYHGLFDWKGTTDFTPWILMGEAVDVVASLHVEGWSGVMSHNQDLALQGRDLLVDRLHLEAPAPDDMLGSMAALLIPPAPEPVPFGALDPLSRKLRHDWQIEVPVSAFPDPSPQRVLRVSAHLYNHIGEYERLAHALEVEFA